MHHQTFLSLFREVLSTPTAPFHEYHVARVIRDRIGSMEHVSLEEDDYGNLIACYRKGKKRPQLAFAAHMDHPGWVRHDGKPVFLGWVPEERLKPSKGKPHPVEWFGEFGMWDLDPFRLEDGIIHARVCDDLIGCAAILALFLELEKKGVEATVYGLFTRAEEVGFLGSIEMAKKWPLPKGVCFVSLETSAPRGGAKQGDGPVIRAGDRISIFDDATTSELVDAADAEKIPHQRALLDGGACEATAMNLYGIPAAGISILLGNYHNVPEKKGIKEEFVSLEDAKNLVRLITATTVRMSTQKKSDSSKARLRKRLEKRLRDHRKYERASRKSWKNA